MIGSVLLLDVGLRLYGLGVKVSVRNWASIFDAIVLLGMQATTIPLIIHSESAWEVSWANFQLQKASASLYAHETLLTSFVCSYSSHYCASS